MNLHTLLPVLALAGALPLAAQGILTPAAPPSASGAGHSLAPVFSGDGQTLLFVSAARNLVPDDPASSWMNIYARDLASGRITRISPGGGDTESSAPSPSHTGRQIAFESVALSVAPRLSQIYLRDLDAATTCLASVSSAGAPGDASSRRPMLSTNGEIVFFESSALNLTAEPRLSGTVDVFQRNLRLGTTRLASISAARAGSLDSRDSTELCAISPDGRLAAFVSTRGGFCSNSVPSLGALFVRDMESETTVEASREVPVLWPPAAAGFRCLGAALSADGRYVIFKAAAAGSPLAGLFRHDLTLAATLLLATNALPSRPPSLSADGRTVAFDASVSGQDTVLLWDERDGLCAPAAAGLGEGPSCGPVLSADGLTLALAHAPAPAAGTEWWNPAPFQTYAGACAPDNRRAFALARVTTTLAGAPSLRDHQTAGMALQPGGAALAFESSDETLAPGDGNRASDVFLRSLPAGPVQLMSARLPEKPARTTAAGIRPVEPGCLDAGGRLLAFRTAPCNLDASDTNWVFRMALAALATGRHITLGVSTNGLSGQALAGPAGGIDPWSLVYLPTVSADGRFLFFQIQLQPQRLGMESYSVSELLRLDLTNYAVTASGVETNYGGGCIGPASVSADGRLAVFSSRKYSSELSQVWLRDYTAQTNALLSCATNGAEGNDDSDLPVLSPDARWVLFFSKAGNLGPAPFATAVTNLYLKNLETGELRCASRGPDGSLGYLPPARFSADSRFVIFAGNSHRVYIHDLARRTTTAVGLAGASPVLSGDGRFAAVESRDGNPGQILLWDRETDASTVASVNRSGTAPGNGPSSAPFITPNGRFIVFASAASDLVPGDDNGASDLFIRDRLRQTTLLLSRGLSGLPARGASLRPVPSPDGTAIAFTSLAHDLVEGDYNDTRDAFVLHLPSPDSDGDGMDDDWERAAFGTRERDGTADFDGDGLSDLQEFIAATDPALPGSVLRVFILASPGQPGVTLFWPAVDGKVYRVQYKDSLRAGAWTDLPGAVTGWAGAASLRDVPPEGSSQRFYRAVVLP